MKSECTYGWYQAVRIGQQLISLDISPVRSLATLKEVSTMERFPCVTRRLASSYKSRELAPDMPRSDFKSRCAFTEKMEPGGSIGLLRTLVKSRDLVSLPLRSGE
jgi:hypothetical protein